MFFAAACIARCTSCFTTCFFYVVTHFVVLHQVIFAFRGAFLSLRVTVLTLQVTTWFGTKPWDTMFCSQMLCRASQHWKYCIFTVTFRFHFICLMRCCHALQAMPLGTLDALRSQRLFCISRRFKNCIFMVVVFSCCFYICFNMFPF
jgi:hypothetical protein